MRAVIGGVDRRQNGPKSSARLPKAIYLHRKPTSKQTSKHTNKQTNIGPSVRRTCRPHTSKRVNHEKVDQPGLVHELPRAPGRSGLWSLEEEA